ncbi:MAG: hypothetical protein RBT40_09005 [Petrimonas sp.]|jgi:hypothetical protein|nr:hypothetical protein [Petrimonas sp.]
MKIEFTVPDGEYCLDCPQQEDFSVSEMECTTIGDSAPRYIREIVANCHLFNQPIRGVALAEMRKCRDCLNSRK